MKENLKKAWKWVQDHAVWVVSILAAIISAILTAMYFKRDDEVEVARSKVKVANIEKKIAKLEAKREVLNTKIAVIDEKDKEADKRIEELHDGLKKEKKEIKSMTPEERLQKFKDLGY